jgi:hypothetical protein
MLSTPVGEVITFFELSKALGANVKARQYLIHGAIKLASKEAGAIFTSVRSVGYKRLPAEAAAAVGSHARNRVRSTARKASGIITRAVERANDMSDEARRKAMTEVSALQLLNTLAADRTVKAVQPTDKPQPVAMTLRSMAASLGIT